MRTATLPTAHPTAAVVVGALSAALALLAVPAPALPAAGHADPAAAAAGARLYQLHCVDCHGIDGSGNTAMGRALKAQDLRKPGIKARKDADLAASISDGKGMMPPQKVALTPAQVRQVVAYLRTLGKPR